MSEHTPNKCLYAASISFARKISKLAEIAFAPIGMHPSQAFLLMIATDEPGVSPTRAAEALSLAPSTITRFADGLEQKGCITRDKQGKNSAIYPTEKGKKTAKDIVKATERLYKMFSEKLGKSEADSLALRIGEAADKIK